MNNQEANFRKNILPHLPCLREGAVDWLSVHGFFTAPASTKYHGAFEGGLYDHSFDVTHYLLVMTNSLKLAWQREESPYLVGMFHDLCKIDQYIAGESIYQRDGGGSGSVGIDHIAFFQTFYTVESDGAGLIIPNGLDNAFSGDFLSVTGSNTVLVLDELAVLDSPDDGVTVLTVLAVLAVFAGNSQTGIDTVDEPVAVFADGDHGAGSAVHAVFTIFTILTIGAVGTVLTIGDVEGVTIIQGNLHTGVNLGLQVLDGVLKGGDPLAQVLHILAEILAGHSTCKAGYDSHACNDEFEFLVHNF